MAVSYNAVVSEETTRETTSLIAVAAAPAVLPLRRTYRGGFHTSICDIFRDPHRRTDCCAVACCGILSSDRSLYLLTGERPPPLWTRVLMYFVIPTLLLAAAMNYYFAANGVTVTGSVDEDDGQPTQTTYKEPSGKLVLILIVKWQHQVAVVWWWENSRWNCN